MTQGRQCAMMREQLTKDNPVTYRLTRVFYAASNLKQEVMFFIFLPSLNVRMLTCTQAIPLV